jgi:hypothetical protein
MKPKPTNPQTPVWLRSTFTNRAEIARRMGLSNGTLSNKIHGTEKRIFTPAELEKLEMLKQEIKELYNN